MVSAGSQNHIKSGHDPVRLWEEEEPWGPYIINAIKAKHLYIKNMDYIVDSENQVKIVNRSTGRVQTKSRWTDNIHQASFKLGLHPHYVNYASLSARPGS